MGSTRAELLPAFPLDRERRRLLVIEWWTYLGPEEEAGATDREALEHLRSQVTDALSRDPPDLASAESATALAALLLTGQREF